MGEAFGQPTSDAEQAFAAFVDTFDWGGGSIDEAMRCLLQAFLLPKEAQQIDRVLKVLLGAFALNAEMVWSLGFLAVLLD